MSIATSPVHAPAALATAVRGFNSWARDQMASPVSTDADDHRPEWPADAYVPTPKEEAEEVGYQIGLTGDRPAFTEVFTDVQSAASDGRGLAFTVGRNRGNREHAGRVGYELGLAGLAKEGPASVHRLVAAEFAAGWELGVAERAARELEMAAYFDQLDWEADALEREHELEMEAREAGGWDRLIARTPE